MAYKLPNIRFFFVLVLFFFLFGSCEDERKPFPYVYVDVTFNISTQLNSLPVGEYIIKEKYGYGGLIIYRASRSSFYAFDRACTYNPNKKCLLEENPNDLMECPCCGSTFLLSQEGMVFGGPSTVPLKQYQAYYRPPNELYVTN
jgi:nitrite reductase/ring-hydroxylating ferredoxin subunit